MLTQKDVAEIVEVEQTTISRWELGTSGPKGKRLVEYLAVLDEMAKFGAPGDGAPIDVEAVRHGISI